MPRIQTDEINGPHVVLDSDCAGYSGEGATLQVRTFYAGPGKVCLTMKDGRRIQTIVVGAAELIDAVQALVPAATN